MKRRTEPCLLKGGYEYMYFKTISSKYINVEDRIGMEFKLWVLVISYA